MVQQFKQQSRVQSNPSVDEQATSSEHRGQAMLGNAAMQDRLNGQDGEGAGNSHHLGYRTTTENGQSRDPEQKDGGLPYNSNGGWNANEILTHLTQVDNDAQTINDGNRCAAVSTLAVHIQGGPTSVLRVASAALVDLGSSAIMSFLSSASDQVKQYYWDMSQALSPIITRLGDNTATYCDIRRVSDAMKLAVDADPNSGTGASEYPELAGLGGGLQAYVGQTYSGLDEANNLASLMSALGSSSLLPNIYAVLAVGTNDIQPDRTNHAVNLGIDKSGQVYLYDPWPRDGKQIMMWASDTALIEPYFENSANTDRTWRVRSLMRPA